MKLLKRKQQNDKSRNKTALDWLKVEHDLGIENELVANMIKVEQRQEWVKRRAQRINQNYEQKSKAEIETQYPLTICFLLSLELTKQKHMQLELKRDAQGVSTNAKYKKEDESKEFQKIAKYRLGACFESI